MKKIFLIAGILFASNLLWAQWEPDVRLTYDTAYSTTSYPMQRSIAASGDTVHVVWCDNRDRNLEVYYKRSTNGGNSWEDDQRLTNDIAASKFSSLVVSGNLVHIVWDDRRDGNREIYYKRSTDGGSTWEADKRLTNGSHSSYEPSVSCSGSIVNIVWTDHDIETGIFNIFSKRSIDGGINWATDIQLTNGNYLKYNPSIATSGLTVHIVWNDLRDVNSEIYYKRSTDGGQSWGPDIRLSYLFTNAGIPSIAVFGLNIHLVWQGWADGNWKVYYKQSLDGGFTWGDDICLINYPAGDQSFPSVAASESVVHIVYQDDRDFETEIHYFRSDDGGQNWNPDIRLTDAPGSSEKASITFSGPVIHIIWTDWRDGHLEIYYKRDPTGGYAVGINNDLAGESDKQFSIYPNPASSVVHINSNVELRNPEVKNNVTNIFIIWNLLGEAILSKQIQNGESVIDISELQNGLYFAGIISGNQKASTTKLIILK